MKPKHTYLVLIAFAIVTIACFTTCKKYPEDKFYSFKTVHGRLQGEWQLHKIELNGNDVGYLYNDSLPQTYDTYRFWFQFKVKVASDDKQNLIYINKSSKSCSASKDADICAVSFGVGYKKENINITNGAWPYTTKDGLSSKLFLNLWGNSFRWYIKKLYQKELILTTESNGNSYVLYYKKTRT